MPSVIVIIIITVVHFSLPYSFMPITIITIIAIMHYCLPYSFELITIITIITKAHFRIHSLMEQYNHILLVQPLAVVTVAIVTILLMNHITMK